MSDSTLVVVAVYVGEEQQTLKIVGQSPEGRLFTFSTSDVKMLHAPFES
jgi:hypothetical protein